MKLSVSLIIVIFMANVFVGIGSQNGMATNTKTTGSEPVWGKTYTDSCTSGNEIRKSYYFPVHINDNITINTTVANAYSQVWLGGITDGGNPLATVPLQPFFFNASSNNISGLGDAATNGLIDTSENFWIVSGLDQIMEILVRMYYTTSIQYTINKINATPIQDPAITNLENKIDNLTTNMTNISNNLTAQINALNSTITNMNQTQRDILENIGNLQVIYDQLNTTLNNLLNDFNSLNISNSEHRNNITRIEQALTNINTEITNLQTSVEDLSTMESNITNIENKLSNTTTALSLVNNNITNLKNSLPKEYNDTVLTNRISQLEKENTQLRTNIDTLNKTKQQKIIEKSVDNAMVNVALAIGIFGVLMAVIALVFSMRKTPPQRSSYSRDIEEAPKPYDEIDMDDGDTVKVVNVPDKRHSKRKP